MEAAKAKIKRWWKFVAYGCGHVQNDMCAAIWFLYYLGYVKDVLGESANHSNQPKVFSLDYRTSKDGISVR